MEIQDLGRESVRLRLVGMEWQALTIPVIRTNDRHHPRGHPRRGWPRWRRSAAHGRDALIATIAEDPWFTATVDDPAEMTLPRAHVHGVIEILEQNARIAGDVPVVSPELVEQMIAALLAWLEGDPIPPVDTGRIEREFAAGADAEWGRNEWVVLTGGLTRRKAQLLQRLLRLMHIGSWSSEFDPRRSIVLGLDLATAAMLRAALSRGDELAVAYDDETDEPVQLDRADAVEQVAGIREDLDEFLTHAIPPRPEQSS
ncbi:hypothetical protein [Curtobacterium sp. RRHDQ10]|uniref:hypothetical protein n=1 Tax=Curtobacterium phyllosphaerae TaxID=3413379 RepID=UPI003BF153C2